MIIKTMQLVGARKRFIRGPFIRTYLVLGIISALIACVGVWALVLNLQTYLPGIDMLMDQQTLLMSFSGVFLLSMFISSISARLATQRYLNLKPNLCINEKQKEFIFEKNYRLMIIGLGVIVLGFILMIGGGSKDPDVFNPDIFNFRRIRLAPALVLIGFGIEIFAIFTFI